MILIALFVAVSIGFNLYRAWNVVICSCSVVKFFWSYKLLTWNPDRYTANLVFENSNFDRQTKIQTVYHRPIGFAYKKIGGEVLIIGEQYKIYKYVITQIAKKCGSNVENVCKKHIAIICNTLETDILGAENANKSMNCNIDSILVMTGMTARSMQDDEKSDVFLMKKFFERKRTQLIQTNTVLN